MSEHEGLEVQGLRRALREAGVVAANLRVGWRASIPRDVVVGLERIEALAVVEGRLVDPLEVERLLGEVWVFPNSTSERAIERIRALLGLGA